MSVLFRETFIAIFEVFSCFPAIGGGSFCYVSSCGAFAAKCQKFVIYFLVNFVVESRCARSRWMVKGREPSFGFKEGSELQVKVFSLGIKPVKFGWVSDVTGLEMLIVVFQDFG
jgi:hypothetical protein